MAKNFPNMMIAQDIVVNKSCQYLLVSGKVLVCFLHFPALL